MTATKQEEIDVEALAVRVARRQASAHAVQRVIGEEFIKRFGSALIEEYLKLAGLAQPEDAEKWAVQIIESEKGWGQKIDEIKYFKSKAEADKFVEEFNSTNTSESAPEWYMQASDPVRVF